MTYRNQTRIPSLAGRWRNWQDSPLCESCPSQGGCHGQQPAGGRPGDGQSRAEPEVQGKVTSLGRPGEWQTLGMVKTLEPPCLVVAACPSGEERGPRGCQREPGVWRRLARVWTAGSGGGICPGAWKGTLSRWWQPVGLYTARRGTGEWRQSRTATIELGPGALARQGRPHGRMADAA